jgi:hypothetical protein
MIQLIRSVLKGLIYFVTEMKDVLLLILGILIY